MSLIPKTLMDGAKCMPGGLLVFLFLKIQALLKIDGAVLFCFISQAKICSSVVREENDGAARPLTCVNK